MNINTYLEVNLENLDKNIKAIKSKIGGKEIFPVVKANAYGLGVDKILDVLNNNNINIACVAMAIEGVQLRECGWKKEILILNPPFEEDIDEILEYDLISGVSRKEYIIELNKKASEQNKIVKVHIELDTGMGRTGVQSEDIEQTIDLIEECSNINLDGIYTHFSTSDEKDSEYMYKQVKCFKEGVEKIHSKGIFPKNIHMSNSGAVLQIEDDFTTAVRPGLILHGFVVADDLKENLKLYPVSKLVSRVAFIKEVEPGTSIGYGRKHISDKKEKIVTVPIGYADGLPRALSNKGKVVINGQICNIVGNVCMDNILVDATGKDNIHIGDKVYLWDNENITIEEIAEMTDTINYEIVTRISQRVQRKYC